MKAKFCPKCKNKQIELVAGGQIGIYECSKCGFRGAIFPEKEIEDKNKKIKMPKENNKTIKLYFCPECKSKEVGYIFELHNIFGIIPRMKCKSCKREGFFPIMVVDLNKLNKNKNKKNARQRRQK